jgi:hypothetical protein
MPEVMFSAINVIPSSHWDIVVNGKLFINIRLLLTWKVV